MYNLKINTSKPYNILIKKGLIKTLPDLIGPFCPSKKILIISDDNIEHLYAQDAVCRLSAAGFDAYLYTFKHGEESKNINTVTNIIEFLSNNKFNRNDAVIALGGGVVGDISGFAASIYMRGINYIQIPTTLLAMVDSSVGGKTGVDLPCSKNIIGSFYQPSIVIIDSDTLQTLPDEIFNEGMGEIIKYSLLDNIDINDLDDIDSIIHHCIKIKAQIVSEDEFDKLGIREKLNIGHTFAHALEVLSNYQVSHGKAVGLGLYIEARIAAELGYDMDCITDKLYSLLNRYNLYFNPEIRLPELAEAMRGDKKNIDDKIVFIISDDNNCIHKLSLTIEQLEKALSKIL